MPREAPVLFWTPPGTPAFLRASREQVLHRIPGLHVQYLGFDLRARESPGVRLPAGERGNPFLEPKIREAISLSIDYEALRRGVLGGMTRPVSQMAPGAVFGFDPALPEPHRDRERARRLMAQSAYPHGFEIDLDVRRQVGASFAPYLVAALETLGIRVRVVTHSDPEFFAHLRAGRSSLYLLRHGCRTGDTQELFDRLVHSRDDARGYGFFSFSYDGAAPLRAPAGGGPDPVPLPGNALEAPYGRLLQVRGHPARAVVHLHQRLAPPKLGSLPHA